MPLIDLTRTLEEVAIEAFPPQLQPLHRIISPAINYTDHAAGAQIMSCVFGCSREELPCGEGWAEETLTLSSHLGTHVDAPWHYGSTSANGESASKVDEIPLEDLFLDAVVLDMSHLRGSGAAITVEALREALGKINYQIKPRDAVLLHTGHDQFAVTDPVAYNYPGLTAQSARFIADQGALVGGTDALGFDRPFHHMIQEYQTSKNKERIWDAHYAMRDYRFYVVQQLCNLGKLPSCGFKVGFFPLKIARASAAPARVVAFLD